MYQNYYNMTHTLDLTTNIWRQQQQQPNGITPRARAWAFGGFLDSNHILVSGGKLINFLSLGTQGVDLTFFVGILNVQAFNDINVLSIPTVPGQSPQWVTTYYQGLLTDDTGSVDGGRIAGIVIGVLLATLLLGLIVWRFGRYIRFVILNLHYDIWRPR